MDCLRNCWSQDEGGGTHINDDFFQFAITTSCIATEIKNENPTSKPPFLFYFFFIWPHALLEQGAGKLQEIYKHCSVCSTIMYINNSTGLLMTAVVAR
jgi:hypothetical protein